MLPDTEGSWVKVRWQPGKKELRKQQCGCEHSSGNGSKGVGAGRLQGGRRRRIRWYWRRWRPNGSN